MKLILWVGAIVATVGMRGLASLMVVGSLVTGVLYLVYRRERRVGNAFQAATEKLRGIGG
jgi:hypothetical protein